jgi:hypothetical protein
VITTKKVLDALGSADGDTLSLSPEEQVIAGEVHQALIGFERSIIYAELLTDERKKQGRGVKLAFALGIEVGYKIAQAEKLEESLNV